MKLIWILSRKRRLWLMVGGSLVIILMIAVGWEVSRTNRIWSWTLGNRVVVIDAGHGGVDPGAVGVNKVLEKDVTLAVSKRLKTLLEQGGAKVVMVREDDQDLGSSEGLLKRKREDLVQRIQLALDTQAEVYISIHANSFPNAKLSGAQTFYHAGSEDSKRLAEAIQQELNSLTNGKRTIKDNQDIYVLKKAHQAAVTVELGFLSNAAEEQLLIKPEYQERLALAVFKGLSIYFRK